MIEQSENIPWLDSRSFNENCSRFPAEELLKYAGQYVAWSLDGTCILASGVDELEMEKRLKEAGIDHSKVVGEFIPPADVVRGIGTMWNSL
jgi:hypothetical protein